MVKKRRDLPSSIQKLVSPQATFKEVAQAEQLYGTGVRDGNVLAFGEVLSHLEKKYMADDAPPRGTPEAEAILELAKELSNLLRSKIEELNAN